MVDIDSEQALALYLSQQIGRAIDESGKTQEAVAEELGVSKAAVSKWVKTGKIKTFSLYQLTRATGKPLHFFFPGADELQTGMQGKDKRALREMLERQVASGNSEFLETALLRVLEAKHRASRSS